MKMYDKDATYDDFIGDSYYLIPSKWGEKDDPVKIDQVLFWSRGNKVVAVVECAEVKPK